MVVTAYEVNQWLNEQSRWHLFTISGKTNVRNVTEYSRLVEHLHGWKRTFFYQLRGGKGHNQVVGRNTFGSKLPKEIARAVGMSEEEVARISNHSILRSAMTHYASNPGMLHYSISGISHEQCMMIRYHCLFSN